MKQACGMLLILHIRFLPIKELIQNWVDQQPRVLDWQCLSLESAQLESYPHEPQLREWVDKGYHGSMSFMEQHLDLRTQIQDLEPGTQSVFQFLVSYPTELKPATPTGVPRVSSYAQGEDYHDLARSLLTSLREILSQQIDFTQFRPFTDSAPVFERDLAQILGLGWLGKNACLINQKYGSSFFLTGFVSDIKIPSSESTWIHPAQDFCGSCTRCLDICPTEAIESPGVINAQKCISYLTIEHKGDILEPLGEKMSDWIYGCDLCQQICPWNHKNIHGASEEASIDLPQTAHDWLQLLRMGGGSKSTLKSTPLSRGGRKKLLRNLFWFVRNHSDTSLIPLCQEIVTSEDAGFQEELRHILKPLL